MTVRSVIFDVIGRDNASKAFESSAAAADAAATSMSKSMATMTKVGANMTKAVTVPVLAIAAVSIKQASDFQKSQTLLQTAGGETAAKMVTISNGIKSLAISTGTSLSQLNAGMYIVAKFGSKFSATDQLTILKAAAEGAKAENVDLGTATTALTTILQSYGLKAAQAVSVQNELVVAAGKSKTTMTDFASSLSNVVPLASSLGISFAQVGGAIATMTQHGETAQQSSDNLANLIRNLAGQNNVASQAMQQLGINTISLQKNLGTNGLSGTLAIVEDALAKNSKGGMVVVSAFKQAQLATGSLNTMLGTMTGDLATQSKGLLAGSVGIQTYRTYARSLGGTAGAAALQFLSLYQSSQGFSNQLKSGNSTVSTAAKQLQNMLGGATGLNVALMLGGNSAATFTANAKAISAAAQESGANIATWAKTSDTLAVKTDQAKERLQVMAVNIGTDLLPVAEDLIADLSKVVDWFSKLSTGTQGTIVKFALVAAAIGPVLTITTRLIKTGSLIIGWGTQVVGSMTGAAAATARASAAESAAVVDQYINYAAWAKVEAEKAEATALAAADIATSLAGTDSALALDSAAAARNAVAFATAQREKAAAAEAAAVKIRASTAASSGAGTAGAEVGAAEGAAAGSAAVGTVALAAVAAAAYFGGKALGNLSDAGKTWIGVVSQMSASAKTLTSDLVSTNGQLTQNAALLIATNLQQDGLAAKANKAHITLAQLTTGITGTNKQFGALVAEWKASGSPSDSTIMALVAMRNGYTTAATAATKQATATKAATAASQDAAKAAAELAAKTTAATDAATSALLVNNQAAASLNNFTTTLNGTNKALTVAGANTAFTQTLDSLGQKTITGANAFQNYNGQANTTTQRLQTLAQQAINTAAAMSAQGDSAKDVAAKLETNVQALEDMATKLGLNKQMVDALIQSMNLTPSQIDTYFDVDVAAAMAKIASLQAAMATIDPGAGGASAHQAAIAAQQIAALQKSISGSGATPAISKTSSASGGSGSGQTIGGGAGAGSGTSSKPPAFSTATMTSFLKSLTGTGSDVQSAYSALLSSGENSKKFSSGLVSFLNKDDTSLIAEVNKRNTIATKLAAAQTALKAATTLLNDEKTSVSSAVTGTFDISSVASQYTDQPTSITTIIASIQTAVANAGAFDTAIRALIAKHVPAGLVQQLLAAGPAALPQARALLGATSAQLATVVGDYTKLTATGTDLGTVAANDFYGAGVKSAQGLVNGLTSQQTMLNKAVTQLADSMVAAIKKSLGIHSPSQVMHDLGVFTGLGFINGVSSQAPAARKAMTNLTTPRSQVAQWHGEGASTRQGDTFYIYEATNPVATAHAVQRRQQMAGRS